MANLSVIGVDGKEVEKMNISDGIVKQPMNDEIIYQEVRRFLASRRAGTHSTKTRSEVRGGGKKPWRQKGTGNARAGTNRSPIWKGGGVVFGPKPRDYSFKLNKKVIKKSKYIALSEKFNDKKLIVLDSFKLKGPKTKEAASILKKVDLLGKKVLFVLEDLYSNEAKSLRNMINITLASGNGLATYDILISEYIVFTKDSLKIFLGEQKNERS